MKESPVKGSKNTEFWRDGTFMLLLKIIHKDVQMESTDRCVTSSSTQAGVERKTVHEFQEKSLISNC